MESPKPITNLLDYFGVERYDIEGEEVRCRCFIHGGDNPRGLSINWKNNVYRCFTRCEPSGGTIIQAICRAEGCEPKEAFEIFEKVSGEEYHDSGNTSRKSIDKSFIEQKIDHDALDYVRSNSIELANYRDFETSTLRRFDLRVGTSGHLNNWVIIPIHDTLGNLCFFKLRALNEQRNKYRVFPSGSKINYTLYNYYRIKQRDRVLVLEGEFKVMKAYEYGYPALSLMGSSMSLFQKEMLEAFKNVYIMMDPDKAGKNAAEKMDEKLDTTTTIVDCPPSADPDELPEDAFDRVVNEEKVVSNESL